MPTNVTGDFNETEGEVVGAKFRRRYTSAVESFEGLNLALFQASKIAVDFFDGISSA